MKAQKIILQISVENQRREFDAKLLLAGGTPPETLSYHKLEGKSLVTRALKSNGMTPTMSANNPILRALINGFHWLGMF